MKQIAFLLLFAGASFAQLSFPQLGGAPAGEVKPETVLATVEGKDVTLADVRKMVAADPRLMQYMTQNPQAAIAQYFLMLHLAGEGEKKKIAEQSPLKEQLETARAIAVAGAMINLERDTFAVSEEEMEAYYKSKRANYEEAHIHGIYLAFQPPSAAPAAGASPEDLAKAAQEAVAAAQNKSTRTEAAAETLAKDLVKQLRAGADFKKLVEQYSDDPGSKATGGDLGVIKPNSSSPEAIRRAVFALSPGEVADPVKSGNAFYILRLEEKMMPPIANVRAELIQNIRQEHLNQYMTELTNRFKPAVKNADFFARPAAILGGTQ
jgi:parvulin-like peptidyl-prolyl isomerase